MPALDLAELVAAKVRDELAAMDGEVERLVADAVDRELDRLVAAELVERVGANGVRAGA